MYVEGVHTCACALMHVCITVNSKEEVMYLRGMGIEGLGVGEEVKEMI